MYLSSSTYQAIVWKICQNIQMKYQTIKMHACNPAWFSVIISSQHMIKLQMPQFIQYQRKIEGQPVVSADTAVFAELSLMIQRLREIYLTHNWHTKIVPYDVQFKSMVDALEKGVDKKQIIMVTINYIESIAEDLRKKGVKLNIATKEDLLNQYVKNANQAFEELARLIDNIKNNYERQGYIVDLLSYDNQIRYMQEQLSHGKSQQAIILEAINKMEDAKRILMRNGVAVDIFPNQESLEKYYIGNDKDYIELASMCDGIYKTCKTYGLPTNMLPYQQQLNRIKQLEVQGNSKEQILRNLIEWIEKYQREFTQRNIPNSMVPVEELYKRYSISHDTTFTSLSQLIDQIRTFYLTHRLNTHLLPYEQMLKIMKDAFEEGVSEERIIQTTLHMVEEAREDLNMKGYSIVLPTKEELCAKYHIGLSDKKL